MAVSGSFIFSKDIPGRVKHHRKIKEEQSLGKYPWGARNAKSLRHVPPSSSPATRATTHLIATDAIWIPYTYKTTLNKPSLRITMEIIKIHAEQTNHGFVATSRTYARQQPSQAAPPLPKRDRPTSQLLITN